MKTDMNSRIVFLLAEGDPNQPKTIILGIPDQANDEMEAHPGLHSKDADLTGVGLPLQIIVVRGATHESIIATLTGEATKAGFDVYDQRKPKQ